MTLPSRRAVRVLSGLLLTLGALAAGAPSVTTPASAAPAPASSGTTTGPGFASTCIGYCKHPTNAAKVFQWGVESWRREFEDRTTAVAEGSWKTNHPALVSQREGMLTIGALPTTRHVTVEAADQSATYGRWEARVRAVEETTGDAPFTFTWELTPTDPKDCADKIVLAQYQPNDPKAKGGVYTAAGKRFGFSREALLVSKGGWHTYAVEVTKDHISWFVDTQVVRTERRPAALTGVTLHPEFEITGQADTRMNRSRMQMDWVRYYDLDRPNALPITAPHMRMRDWTPPTSCGS